MKIPSAEALTRGVQVFGVQVFGDAKGVLWAVFVPVACSAGIIAVEGWLNA